MDVRPSGGDPRTIIYPLGGADLAIDARGSGEAELAAVDFAIDARGSGEARLAVDLATDSRGSWGAESAVRYNRASQGGDSLATVGPLPADEPRSDLRTIISGGVDAPAELTLRALSHVGAAGDATAGGATVTWVSTDASFGAGVGLGRRRHHSIARTAASVIKIASPHAARITTLSAKARECESLLPDTERGSGVSDDVLACTGLAVTLYTKPAACSRGRSAIRHAACMSDLGAETYSNIRRGRPSKSGDHGGHVEERCDGDLHPHRASGSDSVCTYGSSNLHANSILIKKNTRGVGNGAGHGLQQRASGVITGTKRSVTLSP